MLAPPGRGGRTGQNDPKVLVWVLATGEYPNEYPRPPVVCLVARHNRPICSPRGAMFGNPVAFEQLMRLRESASMMFGMRVYYGSSARYWSRCAPMGGLVLNNDALVVRGGIQRDPAFLMAKLEKLVAAGKPADVSVFALDLVEGTREQTLFAICSEAKVPHPRIQVSSATTLVDAGFELTHDPSSGQAECHYHVSFKIPVEESRVRDFISCFSDDEPNPTGGR